MHAIVCIKSVPDTTQVSFDPETNTLVRAGVASTINPFDTYAIEEALRMREAHGGTVTVISMGPPQAENELREALAMGCDRAILLCSRDFAGSDTWATAYTLSRAIRALPPADVVLCGKQAIDGDTGQVGPGIANQLGLPQLTYVFRIQVMDFEAGTIRVQRIVEEGLEVDETRLPALLTVVKDINTPRYPTLRNIRHARRAEIETWTPCDLPECSESCLGLTGSPTQVVKVFAPPQRSEQAVLIEGEPQEAAATLIRILRERQLI